MIVTYLVIFDAILVESVIRSSSILPIIELRRSIETEDFFALGGFHNGSDDRSDKSGHVFQQAWPASLDQIQNQTFDVYL